MKTKDTPRAMPLSESEELLLMRFMDGECGVFAKRKAQRLLACNTEAAEFVRVMQTVGERARNHAAQIQTSGADLWTRVSRRIGEEKRSEIFLGRRDTRESEGLAERFGVWMNGVFWEKGRWGWSLSGSVAALGVALVTLMSGQSGAPGGSDDQMIRMARGSAQRETLTPVSRHERPRILNEQLANVVEVDWMRSDGRLRMLHDPAESSAIIWVKRRDPNALVRQNRRSPAMLFQAATPFGASGPSR